MTSEQFTRAVDLTTIATWISIIGIGFLVFISKFPTKSHRKVAKRTARKK